MCPFAHFEVAALTWGGMRRETNALYSVAVATIACEITSSFRPPLQVPAGLNILATLFAMDDGGIQPLREWHKPRELCGILNSEPTWYVRQALYHQLRLNIYLVNFCHFQPFSCELILTWHPMQILSFWYGVKNQLLPILIWKFHAWKITNIGSICIYIPLLRANNFQSVCNCTPETTWDLALLSPSPLQLYA
jgi:hypothetical protein